MKVLYYDCFSGISGDMNLGAMIDLGVPAGYLEAELGKLELRGWKLEIKSDQRHGIRGTKVTVNTKHEHAHRHLSDIEKIIDRSGLNGNVKELAKKIFRKIADAEAKVHGIPVEKVHFHEVGAMDSIIDIVGAAICHDYLKPDAVYVSEVELGGGMVKCDHGKLPVPAPATAEIIKNIPSKIGGVNFEATTPTGAAILSALGTSFGSKPSLKIEKSAYGVGHKEHPDVPNLLRVLMGELSNQAEPGHEAYILECNIDDMVPEYYEYITGRLFNSGAADVYTTPINMKKNRPATLLSVICEKENIDVIKEILFTETTSLGIRIFPFRKETLVRESESVNLSIGNVRIKRSFYKGKMVSVKPEYDDCARIAAERGIPIKEVVAMINSEIKEK